MTRWLAALLLLLLVVGPVSAWDQTTPSQHGLSFNSSTTSAADTAIVKTITGAANQSTRIASLSAYCSAGTSTLTITEGATTIWKSPSGFVTTTFKGIAWTPQPLLALTMGTSLVVTMATCGGGNTGTLNVQAERW